MAASLERRDADATRRARARADARSEAVAGARAARSGPAPHGRPGARRDSHLRNAASPMTPGRPRRAATLERWRREADLHDRMQQASTRTSPCRSKGRRKPISPPRRSSRSTARTGGSASCCGTYPTEPMPVVLYTSEQFRDITRSPTWAAGAYDGTIRVPMRGALDNREELDRVLGARVHARAHPHAGAARRADVAERGARHRARDRQPRLGGEAGRAGSRRCRCARCSRASDA